MALKECTGRVGRILCLETLPSRRDAQDALFVPPGVQDEWGLFEPSGRCVPEAMTYSGAIRLHTPSSALSLTEDVAAPTCSADYDYIYIGPIEANHSFFHRRSLARFWALPTIERRRLRLVYSTSDLAALLASSYFRGVCEALNLGAENFLRVTSPRRFKKILVPAPSFEELSLIHTVHTDLMHSIGRRWAPHGGMSQPGRVVYLSKEKLSQGNVRVGNEAEITEILERKGVGIVFPELLSYRERVELWASNPIFVGFNNSFMYVNAFFPKRNIINISYGQTMWSNQCLFDEANKNRADYLFSEDGFETTGAGNGFNMTLMARNPRQLAEDIAAFAFSR